MKKILMFFIMCMMTIMSFAQSNEVAAPAKFYDNWSIGVNAGVQTNLHDWNAPQGAVTSITFDKALTPVFSLGFEGQVGWNNLANWNHPYQVHVHNGNIVDNVGVFTYGRVNLMNWLGGYKGKPRIFEVVPFAGVGYGHTFFNSTYGVDTNHALAKVGSSFDFNLGKSRAWTINLRPSVVYNVAQSGVSYGLKMQHAVFEATAGLTYHFKTSNSKRYMTPVSIPAPVEIVREVPVEVPVEVVKEVPIEIVKQVANVTPEKLIIGFAFDSAELYPEAMEALDDLAKNHKVATIVAYASYEDKTPAIYNMNLSGKRAKVIADYLRERGVDIEKAEGLGSLNETSNRIAVVIGK